MDKEQAISVIARIIIGKEHYRDSIKRKRSWKVSEKVMSTAHVNAEIAALELALKHLKMAHEVQS